MATPVIGGNNDRYALTEAQRNTVTALVVVEHLLDHLAELRMATGQPDYSKLNQLVAQLAVSLAKVQAYQTDMERIRFQTKRESIYAISNKTQKVDKRKALRPDLMAKVTDPATTAHIADIACKVHNYASREEAIFGPSSSQWDSHRAPGMPSAAVMMRYLDTDWPGILNQANLFMPSSSTIQRSNSHRREAEEMIEIDKTIFTQPVFKERDRFFKPTITVIPRGEQTITAWCHRRRRIVTRVEAVYECI